VTAVSAKVGFIGLGQMGSVIAAGIARGGYDLTVWDRRPEAIASVSRAGSGRVASAASLAALAAECDVVGICVVDDAQVREVFAGGLLANLKPGSIVVIHSTVSPELCRSLAVDVAAMGAHLIDAPVSRFDPIDVNRPLTVMVGGEPGPVDSLVPLFGCFGDPIVHLGPVGSGMIAKLVNQTLQAANAALGEEALRVGASFGLDPASLSTILARSSGRSFGLELAIMKLRGDIDAGLALLRKDVRLFEAHDEAQSTDDLVALARRFVG
jgi:3-hydroxyisobutyrate dehydrogenase